MFLNLYALQIWTEPHFYHIIRKYEVTLANAIREWFGYFPTIFEFDMVCKGFYPSVSDSEYPISVIDPVSECSKVIFLWCRYPLQSYPTETNTICIRLRIRIEIWKQIRYQYYPSVFDPFTYLRGSILCNILKHHEKRTI